MSNVRKIKEYTLNQQGQNFWLMVCADDAAICVLGEMKDQMPPLTKNEHLKHTCTQTHIQWSGSRRL